MHVIASAALGVAVVGAVLLFAFESLTLDILGGTLLGVGAVTEALMTILIVLARVRADD